MSLSITVTLSGGAALGAYEAGATAALLEAVHVLRRGGEDVSVDAVGGASAGALVAMFAVHAQANGIDPVWLLREAWVERVSLDLLTGRNLRSPLDFARLRERIGELLDPRDHGGRPVHRRQTDEHGDDGRGAGTVGVGCHDDRGHPVGLHVALTGLRGLHYPIRGRGALGPVEGVTFADWGQFTIHPGSGADAITEPPGASVLDFVLASASNPVAFGPALLDRSAHLDTYRENGISDVPDSGRLWYTDGGTLQVEPVGRVLMAARHARDEAGRPHPDAHLTVLVDPRSERPESADAWARDDASPTWTAGIARTLAIIPAQILYDDLRRVEKMNSRQDWGERILDALVPHLDADAVAALDEALEAIIRDERALRLDDAPVTGEGHGREADADGDDARAVLRRALAKMGGFDDKHRTEVAVISPLLLADGEDTAVGGLLAGEIVGDFGGFLDRDLRESDFLLGYASTLRWLPETLPRLGVPAGAVDGAVGAADRRLPDRWHERNRGHARVDDLPVRARLRLARLVLRMGGVLMRDLWGSLRPGRGPAR